MLLMIQFDMLQSPILFCLLLQQGYEILTLNVLIKNISVNQLSYNALNRSYANLVTKNFSYLFGPKSCPLKNRILAPFCFKIQARYTKQGKRLSGIYSPNGNRKNGWITSIRNLTQTSHEEGIGEVSSSFIISHD